MFEERQRPGTRARRLAAEAKAIRRKFDRNGNVSTKDIQRLTRVNGSLVKFGVRDSYDNDSHDNYEGRG